MSLTVHASPDPSALHLSRRAAALFNMTLQPRAGAVALACEINFALAPGSAFRLRALRNFPDNGQITLLSLNFEAAQCHQDGGEPAIPAQNSCIEIAHLPNFFQYPVHLSPLIRIEPAAEVRGSTADHIRTQVPGQLLECLVDFKESTVTNARKGCGIG